MTEPSKSATGGDSNAPDTPPTDSTTDQSNTDRPDAFTNDSPETSSISPDSIEGLFLQALQKPDPADRAEFLSSACGEDQGLKRRVAALLRAYDDAGSFLEEPANGPRPSSEVSLSFLKPIDKAGVLGTIGPYEVLEVIGRGGMGVVLRAVDLKLNRIVAVKALLPELAANPNSRRRFLREAQAAAAISHSHVVTIHAVDDTHEDANGKPVPPYLVMECVIGQSLQQKLDRVGTLRLAEILRIGRQIGEGMAAAHKQGVIHRDIKPANILLENGVERVKITDFGLARAIDDITVTRTGEVSGTPQYMSPEQACGERVDHRSDLFSLGCVMYAMCTGHSPFRGDSIAHVIKRVTQDTPRPIDGQNPEIPKWLMEIITCLLHKNPAHRFQSAEGLVAILDQHLSRIQHPTESGSHSIINQQMPSSASHHLNGGIDLAIDQTAADVSAPYFATNTVAAWRIRLSNVLLWVGVPLLFLGICFLIGLAQGKTWQVAAFPSLQPHDLTLWALGIAVVCLLPAAFLRASPHDSAPTGGSLLAWFLVGGPIGIVAWLLDRESRSRHVASLRRSDSAGPRAPATAHSTAADPPLSPPGLLGPSGKVLVPNWLRSLSRIWLLLASAFVVVLLVTQNTAKAQIGPAELLIVFSIGGFGSILMAILLSRKTLTREVMAVAMFLGLGPLGLLLYLLIKDGLQPATADDVEVPQPIANIREPANASSNISPWLVTRIPPALLLMLPAGGGVLLSVFMQPRPVISSDLAANVFELFRYPMIFAGIWIAQLLLNKIYHRDRFPMRHYALASSAVLASMAVGWYWSVALRMSTPQPQQLLAWHKLIGGIVLPTIIWVLYCVHVGREVGRAHDEQPDAVESQASTQASSASSKPVMLNWKLLVAAAALLFVSLYTFVIPHFTAFKSKQAIGGKVANFVASRFDTLVISMVETAPGRMLVVTTQDGKESLVHVRRTDNGQWELDPEKHATKIEIGKGDTLGPANDEWGGLILDCGDPGTFVAIMGLGPRISGQGYERLPAGRHKLPVGSYSIMVFDTQAGWLRDVKSNPNGDYAKIFPVVDEMYEKMDLGRKPYDAESGTFAFSEYSHAPNGSMVAIKPGEFASVVARRDLKSIAGGSWTFNRDSAERFMPGQFYRFLWNGEKYSLSAEQAKVVNQLLQRLANDTTENHAMTESEILNTLFVESDSPPETLAAVFNEGKHPAWNRVIFSDTDTDTQQNTFSLVPLATG